MHETLERTAGLHSINQYTSKQALECDKQTFCNQTKTKSGKAASYCCNKLINELKQIYYYREL